MSNATKSKSYSRRAAGVSLLVGVLAGITIGGGVSAKAVTGAAGTYGAPTNSLTQNICGANGSTACAIGLRGPGGGIVFIIPSTPGNTSGLFYEAAPSTWYSPSGDPKSAWCDIRETLLGVSVGFTGISAMDGAAKTTVMLGRCASGAAYLARRYSPTVNGVAYVDWFLPSKRELNEMYINKDVIGGFVSDTYDGYWSSSQFDAYHVWMQNFNRSDNASLDDQIYKNYVRPVRTFAVTNRAAGAKDAAGTKGDTGAKGEAGAKGAAGPAGLRGFTGAAGAAGAKGAAGAAGPAGAKGEAGAKGAAGAKGDTGAAGSNGAAGAKGAAGAAGPAGLRGFTGAAGAAGPAGLRGFTGAAGAAGAKGAAGAAGPAGAKGETGAAGRNGAAGAKGDKGARGFTGTTGAAGAKGETGAAGNNGATGAAGTNGTNGTNGAPTNSQTQNICGANGATACAIGLQGPGGGIVFMTPSTPGNTLELYYEAAPSTWSSPSGDPTSAWCNNSNRLLGVASSVDGTGAMDGANKTVVMLGVCTSGAANLADAYTATVNGVVYGDWFLPSKGELNQMYVNRTAIGGFGGDIYDYWTSSEYDATSAWRQWFNGGGIYPLTKTYASKVRPVRVFSVSNGAKGDTGPTGPIGAKGDTGAAGSNGAAGAKGDTGPTGPIGAKGDTGAAGSNGAAGAKGDTGVKGDTGTAGSNGANTNSQIKNICGVDGTTACAVGLKGPGGGIVFMTPSTAGNTSGLFYEAAPSTWSSPSGDPTSTWCDNSNTLLGVASTLASTGAMDGANKTAVMLGECTSGAANLADAYTATVNGVVYGDWFLPSKGELNQMYVNKTAIGSFASGYFWSSSEVRLDAAWFQLFNTGGQYAGNKWDTIIHVRPVRAF